MAFQIFEQEERIWNECIQVAVADKQINPFNMGHPYRNNYIRVEKSLPGRMTSYLEEISSGDKIFKLEVWNNGSTIEIQGVALYKNRRGLRELV